MISEPRTPTLFESLIPIIVLVMLLTLNVFIFSDDATYGSNQLALLFAATVAALLSSRQGNKWKAILDGIVKSISSAMAAILILMLIGALAGTWLISGIVPALIYYGLEILNPTIFLFAAVIVSAIVSIATGSSWTTAATVGIALVGIGQAMGIHDGVVAGAIISGAYFGDKMSPMSDTTNLAPAMAGTDLFTHIRYMAITTIPSISITLIIFLIWGFTIDSGSKLESIAVVQEAITSKFHISLWLFLVPAVVIGMIIKKVPALPALLTGTILGGILAVVFQPDIVLGIAGKSEAGFYAFYEGVIRAMYTETSVATGNPMVDDLLSAGGMFGMMNTIWLIICAMIFGGTMETAGMLQRLAHSIIQYAHSTGSLVASTALTCGFINVTASDQYIAIVVPGRMFANTYKERGLAPENLSRTLEDSGTVTSVLVPWNTCGAYHAGVLGVATFAYLPFAFFNLISPLMTIFFAYAGIKIKKLKDGSK
ncbi:MAG: Na+/H+ antiporter NhaC [Bacteroidetes bacterium]|nr:MAG: Na+/H+ antiporter NhaC [Bacteroidota bacterium]